MRSRRTIWQIYNITGIVLADVIMGNVCMELYSLQVFLTVATEKSFSRAAEKLLRTQPAVSLALQRLEQELGEKLIDRSGKELHPDRRRPHRARLRAPLSEPAAGAGQLAGRAARQLRRAADHRRQRIHHPLPAAPHRALPRAVPEGQSAGAAQPLEQDPQRAAGRQPGAGRDQLRSGRRAAEIEGDLHRRAGLRGLAASTGWPAARPFPSPSWRPRISSRTTCSRRTAKWCCASFRRTRCRCAWTWRCRPSRPSASWCRATRAWRSCRACAWSRRSSRRLLCEVRVKEMHVERKIRLVYPTRRALSHAAKAFLEVVG